MSKKITNHPISRTDFMIIGKLLQKQSEALRLHKRASRMVTKYHNQVMFLSKKIKQFKYTK